MKLSQTKSDIVRPYAGEALKAYLEANISNELRAISVNGRLFDDKMAALASAFECGWYRDYKDLIWRRGLPSSEK